MGALYKKSGKGLRPRAGSLEKRGPNVCLRLAVLQLFRRFGGPWPMAPFSEARESFAAVARSRVRIWGKFGATPKKSLT